MEGILKHKECFKISIKEIEEHSNQDSLDMKWLSETQEQLQAILTGKTVNNDNLTAFGEGIMVNGSVVEDEKENFLMPPPRGRPPRNRKINTKDTLEEGRMSKPARVTRSSKMSEVIVNVEDTASSSYKAKKTRKIKASTEGSLLTGSSSSEELPAVMITDAESSMTAKSTNSRRTTRKVKGKPIPRVSRATRASTRSSIKRKSSVLSVRKSTGKERIKRSRAAIVSSVVETCAPLEDSQLKVSSPSPASNKNKPKKASAILFSPYAPNSVKQRVEAFEELTSKSVPESIKGEEKETLLTVEPHSSKEIKSKVDSPIVKSKGKLANKKALPIGKVSSKELGSKNVCGLEVDMCDAVIEEEEVEPTTSKIEEHCECDVEIDEKDIEDINYLKVVKKYENEADDEWLSDDEDNERERVGKKKNRLDSSTPKTGKVGDAKSLPGSFGAYKSLRSRKKPSTDLALTLLSKSKTSGYHLNNGAGVTYIQQQKPIELENKEAELKKKMEKEVEALKRKEEMMKKKTEAAKKKREEKMAKVKRTREEKEKELKDAKEKKRKLREEKKIQTPVAIPAAEPEKTPFKGPTPREEALNATFEVVTKEKETEVDSYNMTPCWQDVTPIQPNNPNDYGIVDKSDCSSEEDNDPRKKIPLWAQIKSNDPKFQTQALLSQSFINGYWNCKPRAPTIKEFFGHHVSSKTLRRGLNYRTSSAFWNTPPLMK